MTDLILTDTVEYQYGFYRRVGDTIECTSYKPFLPYGFLPVLGTEVRIMENLDYLMGKSDCPFFIQARIQGWEARTVIATEDGPVDLLDDYESVKEKLKEALELLSNLSSTGLLGRKDPQKNTKISIQEYKKQLDAALIGLDLACDLLAVPERNQDEGWYEKEKEVYEIWRKIKEFKEEA